MKAIYGAQCIERERFRKEVLPRYSDDFDEECVAAVEAFFRDATGDDFYVKENEDGTLDVFAPWGKDACLHFVVDEEGVVLFEFDCSVFDLEEERLMREEEREYLNGDFFFRSFSIN